MGKPLSVQATDRIGKQWGKSKLTREGTIQYIKAFARFTEQRFGLENISNLKPGHVLAYVRDMQDKALSSGTIANRLSAIRLLACAIGKANIVHRSNAEYDVSRIRQNPISANRVLIDSIKAQIADRAASGDRTALMALAAAELRDAFGLRAKESLMTSKVTTADGTLRLIVEGAKGGRQRELEIRTPEQLRAVQLASEVAMTLGSATGRIIPPEMSLQTAYAAQRTLWRDLGGTRVVNAHMHSQRHHYLQNRHAEGATRHEIMREAGHGEDRVTFLHRLPDCSGGVVFGRHCILRRRVRPTVDPAFFSPQEADTFQSRSVCMASDSFELVTVEEFARRMSVSRSTVFAWLTKGMLPDGKLVIRIGKTIRFVWSLEALSLIQRQCEETEAPDLTNGAKRSPVNLDY